MDDPFEKEREVIRRIPLTQGKFTIVDADDFEKFGGLRWYAFYVKKGKTFYAARNSRCRDEDRPSGLLHRLIMSAPAGMDVDHINHDTLDNRKKNLRLCAHHNNLANRKGAQRKSRSGIRGVSRHKASGKWIAQITVRGHHPYLGIFSNKKDAAKAYAVANKKYFGEFGGSY